MILFEVQVNLERMSKVYTFKLWIISNKKLRILCWLNWVVYTRFVYTNGHIHVYKNKLTKRRRKKKPNPVLRANGFQKAVGRFGHIYFLIYFFTFLWYFPACFARNFSFKFLSKNGWYYNFWELKKRSVGPVEQFFPWPYHKMHWIYGVRKHFVCNICIINKRQNKTTKQKHNKKYSNRNK